MAGKVKHLLQVSPGYMATQVVCGEPYFTDAVASVSGTDCPECLRAEWALRQAALDTVRRRARGLGITKGGAVDAVG